MSILSVIHGPRRYGRQHRLDRGIHNGINCPAGGRQVCRPVRRRRLPARSSGTPHDASAGQRKEHRGCDRCSKRECRAPDAPVGVLSRAWARPVERTVHHRNKPDAKAGWRERPVRARRVYRDGIPRARLMLLPGRGPRLSLRLSPKYRQARRPLARGRLDRVLNFVRTSGRTLLGVWRLRVSRSQDITARSFHRNLRNRRGVGCAVAAPSRTSGVRFEKRKRNRSFLRARCEKACAVLSGQRRTPVRTM